MCKTEIDLEVVLEVNLEAGREVQIGAGKPNMVAADMESDMAKCAHGKIGAKPSCS